MQRKQQLRSSSPNTNNKKGSIKKTSHQQQHKNKRSLTTTKKLPRQQQQQQQQHQSTTTHSSLNTHSPNNASFSTFTSDLNVEYNPAHVTTGPEPAAIRSVFRQLLRNSNPRIQSMRPRRSIRLSHGYNAIVNEYRTKMNCSIHDAWKGHATASQLVQALKANTYNANTLYQSGWKPARPQKQQVDSVARSIGLGLNENKSDDLDAILNPTKANLEEMLLFTNKSKIRIDPKTDTHQQILGDDSVFMDIFGGSETPQSISQALGQANVDTQGINDDLQRALFQDLGFDEPGDEGNNDDGTVGNPDNGNNTPFLLEENDLMGFPVLFNPNKKRINGLNGWEVPTSKLTSVFRVPLEVLGAGDSSRSSSGNDSHWDSALSYSDGSLNFTRSLVISTTNSIQHNEDVYGLGLMGCLLNGVENIAHPRTTEAFYSGVNNFTPTQRHKM